MDQTPSRDAHDLYRDVAQRADRLAARLSAGATSFAAASADCRDEYRLLREAIARLEARFAFDREGRPNAIAAVREALPLMERELFDAILDDHACELAATEEALFQVGKSFADSRSGLPQRRLGDDHARNR